jgi:hypothetical protein
MEDSTEVLVVVVLHLLLALIAEGLEEPQGQQ